MRWLRAIFRPRPVRVVSACGGPTRYRAEIRRQSELAHPHATVTQAVAAWEVKGPTSLTVALMAEALYGVHDAFSEFAGKHSAALHTIAQDPRDPDFADDWCALAALATTVQTRVLPVTTTSPPPHPSTNEGEQHG